MSKIKIANRWIGANEPTYFIADIAANHDGNIERAKKLIYLAKASGADAAKFQNFTAPKIVSKFGFESLASNNSHQSKWKKSVFEVYRDASIPLDWTPILAEYCREVGIHYFSTPYDFEAVDVLEPYVPAYKIGSGDITWPEMLEKIAGKGKPVIMATGASTIDEVIRAANLIRNLNQELILMQCNTNYTSNLENFKYIHLNVLKTFGLLFPELVLGLSDHTPGHSTVLGAIALGAKIIEKHFTDDLKRDGPDHGFSMNPSSWREMVERTRELETAMGSAIKTVEDNESDTVVLQRRSLRAAKDLKEGILLTREMIDVLRPAPRGAIYPYEMKRVLGRRLRKSISAGQHFTWFDLE